MEPRFCPHCAAALVTRSDGGRERPACPECAYIAYRNPTPVALMLASKGDRLLLVRRANDPLRGFWAPPAGYVEIDESVENAAIRETAEETGLTVVADGLAGVYSEAGTGILIVAYRGRVSGGEAVAGDEVEEVGLFERAALPSQPRAHSGSLLDRWFRSVIDDLLSG